jgi:tripartite-type tricarboxylate transporter receptor subunit TctC
MTLTRRTVAACLASGYGGFSVAQASVWPRKPIQILVVYPPGGVSDSVARDLAQRMTSLLGVPVLVHNRAGDGGNVGMRTLARSAPDGQTLAFSAITPLTLKPHTAGVDTDPLAGVAPVAAVMATPVLVVGTPSFTGRDIGDLLSQARDRPGALRWATSGVATTGHLVLEQVRLAASINITHVPYKGGAQQINDALAGEFELLSTNVAELQLQHIRDGRLKALAVGAPARLSVLPAVPTFAELGMPAANVSSLFGLFAPAGTPEEHIARLNHVVNSVLAQPDFDARLRSTDNLPVGGPALRFTSQIRQQWVFNKRLVWR